jgi:hypothetical protein
MKPEEFKPIFDPSFYVFETDPKTNERLFLSGISEKYCLTEGGAQELVQVLSSGTPAFTATVFDDMPKGRFTGGPFEQSGTVPWLRISRDGATIEVNAGELATAYYGKSGPDQTPEQVKGTAAYYDARCRADLDARLTAAKEVV